MGPSVSSRPTGLHLEGQALMGRELIETAILLRALCTGDLGQKTRWVQILDLGS